MKKPIKKHFKWTKDEKYYGEESQVDAYDRGEEVVWKNQYGDPETQNVERHVDGCLMNSIMRNTDECICPDKNDNLEV